MRAQLRPKRRFSAILYRRDKSNSMCFYAGKLLQQPEMNNPTLVVVTDRNDLDGQLYRQFCAAKDLLEQTPEQAASREQLREMLAARKSGGIIFTTIQKFSLESQESDHPVLCTRSNVVVITDEVHRSQYGTKAKLVDVKDRVTKEVIGKKYVFGYAKHMRDAAIAAVLRKHDGDWQVRESVRAEAGGGPGRCVVRGRGLIGGVASPRNG